MTFSTLIKTAFKGIILALIFSGGVAKYGKAEVNLNSLGSGLRDIVSAFRKNDSWASKEVNHKNPSFQTLKKPW